jgi:hypothetical protein
MAVRLVLLFTLSLLVVSCDDSPMSTRVESQRFYWHGVHCDVGAWRPGIGLSAKCQTRRPRRAATLDAAGLVRLCTGPHCVENLSAHAVELELGQKVQVDPFVCTSAKQGVRCMGQSGRGFYVGRRHFDSVGVTQRPKHLFASSHVYSVRVNGSGLRSLYPAGGGLSRGTDGRIAFLVGRFPYDYGTRLAVMNDDGTGVRILTRADQGWDTPQAPVWSPDGALLAVFDGSLCESGAPCGTGRVSGSTSKMDPGA